jgi:hypothetical protein
MRREAEFFHDETMDLVYIAKRLGDARRLEEVLTEAGWEYYVEVDHYRGGLIFSTLRAGAFFYVLETEAEKARYFLPTRGYKPQPPLPEAPPDKEDPTP